MSFKVSDKVVRVVPRRHNPGYKILGAPMVVGQIYVVSDVFPMFKYHDGVADAIYLVGCEAFWEPWGIVIPWTSEYFRKLDEIQEENRTKNKKPNRIEILDAIGTRWVEIPTWDE